MATVKVLSIGPDKRHIGNSVEVVIEMRGSTGRLQMPFVFPDQGDAAANERHARQELRTLLEEALQALKDE